MRKFLLSILVFSLSFGSTFFLITSDVFADITSNTRIPSDAELTLGTDVSIELDFESYPGGVDYFRFYVQGAGDRLYDDLVMCTELGETVTNHTGTWFNLPVDTYVSYGVEYSADPDCLTDDGTNNVEDDVFSIIEEATSTPPTNDQGIQAETFATTLFVSALSMMFYFFVWTFRRLTAPQKKKY